MSHPPLSTTRLRKLAGVLRARPDELPAGVLLLEPRMVYDRALLGYTYHPRDRWPRVGAGNVAVAVYSRARCIAAITDWMECDEDEAAEWFEYNTAGAWVGEGTPTFRA